MEENKTEATPGEIVSRINVLAEASVVSYRLLRHDPDKEPRWKILCKDIFRVKSPDAIIEKIANFPNATHFRIHWKELDVNRPYRPINRQRTFKIDRQLDEMGYVEVTNPHETSGDDSADWALVSHTLGMSED